MTVTYQVGGGGHMDIDFWVSLSLPQVLGVAAHGRVLVVGSNEYCVK